MTSRTIVLVQLRTGLRLAGRNRFLFQFLLLLPASPSDAGIAPVSPTNSIPVNTTFVNFTIHLRMVDDNRQNYSECRVHISSQP